MPLQIGDDSSQGWRAVKDLRVGDLEVHAVVIPEGNSWVELWRRVPFDVEMTSSQTLIVPTWAVYVNIILLGGGGGGAGGNGANNAPGRGGSAGSWQGTIRKVQPGEGLVFTIGAGGAGGRTEKASGGTGGTTSVTSSGYTMKAYGGAGGLGTGSTSTAKGEDASKFDYGGMQATGGSGGTMGNVGETPGGGGGGGAGGIFGKWSPGKPGGRGGAWVRFRSA